MNRWNLFLSALVLSIIVAGCGNSSSNEPSGGDNAKTGNKGSTAEAAPEGPLPVDKPTGEVKVEAFKGGYGIDGYQLAATDFQKLNPGLKVEITGDPRIWVQLQAEMASGDPPDLMFPGWGMDHWALIQEGQVMSLDKALDGPAYDGKGTWRSTFDPNILKLCQKDGKTYILPYYTMVFGWWYDPGLFAKHGWTTPKTYTELLALCDKIKAAGMAPITYQGQYPYYMLEGILYPWVVSIGGIDVMRAAQNLEPGAWKNPAILTAAKMIDDLNRKGDFQTGATGMSHTESQTQFLNGKAAMIPCGSWLYSEMEKSMPAGAKMEYMLPPVVENGKGDPTALEIGIEPWMVASQAKNAVGAISLFRYMTSLPQAKAFVQKKYTLMAIAGSDAGPLPPVLVNQAAAMKASKTIWSDQFRNWYPAMEKDIEGALTSMLNKELTPQQFVDRCEAAAEKARKDSSLPKYKVAG